MKNLIFLLLLLNHFSFAQDYCIPEGNTPDEWIEKIEIGNWTSHSGDNEGYKYFTEDSTLTLSYGEQIPFLLTPGYTSEHYSEGWKVWIDFNDNGNFYDEGEEIVSIVPTKGEVSGSFTLLQPFQGKKKMRVMMAFNKQPTPCANLSYGEIEDYDIFINGPSLLQIADLSTTSTSCTFSIHKTVQQFPSQWVEIELRNEENEVQYFTTNQDSYHIDHLKPRSLYTLQLRGYEEPIASVPLQFLSIDEDKIIQLQDHQIDTVGDQHTIVDNGGLNDDYLSLTQLSHLFLPEDTAKVLALDIFHFDLEKNYDFLTIHDVVEMQEENPMDRLTGFISGDRVFSDAGGLKLNMTSDLRINKSGFVLFPTLLNHNQDTLRLIQASINTLEFNWPLLQKDQEVTLRVEDEAGNFRRESYHYGEPILIENLYPNTHYTVKFNTETSSFSQPQTFKTQRGFPELSVMDRGTNFISVQWSTEGFEEEIFYIKCHSSNDTMYFSTEEKSVLMEQLEAGTKYNISIAVDSVKWSSPHKVTTLFEEVIAMSSDTIVVTEGLMYTDPGGLNNNYTDKTEIIQTLYPPSEDYLLSVEFIDLKLEENYDSLTVYADTLRNSGQLLQKYSSTYEDLTPLYSNHQSGALIFSFDADRSVNAEGWVALVDLHIKPPHLAVNEVTENSVSLSWPSDRGEQFVLELIEKDTPVQIIKTEGHEYTFHDLNINTEYKFRIKIDESIYGEIVTVRTLRNPPKLSLHSVYDTLVYLEIDSYENEEISVIFGDSSFVVNTSTFSLPDLKPQTEYQIQAQYSNSELSEPFHFSTQKKSPPIQVYLKPIADTIEQVRSGDVRLMLSNEYQSVLDLSEEQFIYYEIVGEKEVYTFEEQSKESKVYKYQLKHLDELTAFFDIPLAYLMPQGDTVRGVNAYFHNGNRGQGEQFYIPYAFSVRNINTLFQGDTVLELSVMNSSKVEKIYLDQHQIDFEVNNDTIIIHLPEFLGETEHEVRLESQFFYEEKHFIIEGEQQLLTPEIQTFSFLEADSLWLDWQKVFGASAYEYEFYNDSTLLSKGITTDTTITLSELKEGNFYQVNIRSIFNTIGETSEWSSKEFYKPRETFVNPKITFNDVTYQSIHISWDKVAEAEKYYIRWGEHQSLDNEMYMDSNTLRLDNLSDSTLYYFEIVTIYPNAEYSDYGARDSISTLRKIRSIVCEIQSNREGLYTIAIDADDIILDTLEIELSDDPLFQSSTFDTVTVTNNNFNHRIEDSKYIRVRGIKEQVYITIVSNSLYLEEYVPELPVLYELSCRIEEQQEDIYTIVVNAGETEFDSLEVEFSNDSTFSESTIDTVLLVNNHFDFTVSTSQYIQLRGIKEGAYVTHFSNVIYLEAYSPTVPELEEIQCGIDAHFEGKYSVIVDAGELEYDTLEIESATDSLFASFTTDTLVLENSFFNIAVKEPKYIRLRGLKENFYVTDYSNILYLEAFVYEQPTTEIQSITDSSALVLWNEVEGAKEYQIELIDSLGSSQYYTITDTAYLLEGLNSDTWYKVKIGAKYYTLPYQDTHLIQTFKTMKVEKRMGDCEVMIMESEENHYVISLSSSNASHQFEIISSSDSLFETTSTTVHHDNIYTIEIKASMFLKVRGVDSLKTIETSWSNVLFLEYEEVITAVNQNKILDLKFNGPEYTFDQLEFSYPVHGTYLLHYSDGTLLHEGIVDGVKINDFHSSLPQGIYFLSVVNRGVYHIFKLIKR
ncbi:GEVED domain-containing protein [Flammeovirga sp. SJP92]|uniref:GEVED domain-containing protein n=1 Tax=Flammeovirga sp. SJP92 TaxID=1775430 RepID=UPI0012FC187D|nr:GEVED domain-containing protein [Flammeovirga sp. SJP92]